MTQPRDLPRHEDEESLGLGFLGLGVRTELPQRVQEARRGKTCCTRKAFLSAVKGPRLRHCERYIDMTAGLLLLPPPPAPAPAHALAPSPAAAPAPATSRAPAPAPAPATATATASATATAADAAAAAAN